MPDLTAPAARKSAVPFSAVPAASGLYDPANDKDACGVAFVADARGRRSRDIVAKGLTALHNLDHRGAAGAEPNSGDGAGILTQVPDALLRASVGFDLPPAGEYAVGIAFMPADDAERAARVEDVARLAEEEGLTVLGWRDVPIDPEGADLGPTARAVMPHFAQLFVAETMGARADERAFGGNVECNGVTRLERRSFVLRKRAERAAVDAGSSLYIASLSSRTITYKGMLTTDQLPLFFTDLRDERYESAIALVHSRFSTNTFPSWPLAHPFRFIAHNGEINTIKGNRNRMRAREAKLATEFFDGPAGPASELGLERIFPVTASDFSDSATFDEVLELLHLSGRSLPHAVLMMIPEAWENHDEMDPARRAFYRFHSSIMEPWDGPAAVCFTDGTLIGAVLDRNGLRPGRWWHTKDDLVVLASEVGVLDIPAADVVAKGRLQPGRMFLVDTAAGRIVSDEEVKGALAAENPYEDWLHAGLVHLPTLPERRRSRPSHESVVRRQALFGYTEEELRVLVQPMAASGAEPIGSMGTDTPIAALSDRSRLLYDYFGQLFAQVTNPPLDAIREELVTSLGRTFGPEQNLLQGDARLRAAGLPAVPGHRQRRAGQDPAHRRRRRPARVRRRPDHRPLRRQRRRPGAGPGRRGPADQGLQGDRGRRPHHRAVRPRLRREARADPVAAHDRRGAPPPGAGEDPHGGRAGRRVRRRPRGAPRRAAARLRRGRGQPLPGLRVDRGPHPRRCAHRRGARAGRAQHGQGAGQGRPQGHEQDGHQHRRLVHDGADLRGRGPVPGPRRRVLHRHLRAPGRRRHRRARRGGGHAPPPRLPGEPHRAGAPPARGGRGVPVAPRGGGAPVQPRDGVPAPARHPIAAVRRVPEVHRRRRPAQPGRRHPARPVRAEDRRPAAGADRRGRARQRDRQAVPDRRDELRLHLAGVARDPRDRHEPARWQVQHR